MGTNLKTTVLSATGLPQSAVEKEFDSLLAKHGKNAEELTLDELREVMADYLQTVFLELSQNEESIGA